jgi:hypothetical protein
MCIVPTMDGMDLCLVLPWFMKMFSNMFFEDILLEVWWLQSPSDTGNLFQIQINNWEKQGCLQTLTQCFKMACLITE